MTDNTDESQTCPKCNSPYGYPDAQQWICPECFHEWTLEAPANADDKAAEDAAGPKFVDVNGVELHDGDAVIVAQDLKVGKSTIKSGTKVKSIRLLDEPVNGHDISCKVGVHGSMYLKCSVVKKA